MSLKQSISSSYNPVHLVNAFNSQDFIKAISMVIAMALPIFIGVRYDELNMGIHVTLGVVFASFSDSTGNLRLKVTGMLLASLLTLLVTFIFHFLRVPLWYQLPALGIIIFCISYLSIYGFRASLISFSGLFAIVLSFSTISDSDLSIYTRLPLIALGCLWYIGLTILRQVVFPRSSTEFYIAETLKRTADFLDIRAKLIDKQNDRKKLLKDLLVIQKDITDNHETLRELLIRRRRNSGKSFYQARRTLIFRQLVDILELAMANPVNYYKTDGIFENKPEQQKYFQDVMVLMGKRLRLLASHLNKPQKLTQEDLIEEKLVILEQNLKDWKRDENGEEEEEAVIQRNYLKYLRAQLQKVKEIERLMKNQNRLEIKQAINADDFRFLTHQNYNLSVLVDNFTIKSTIFRHSLRIAIVAVVGFGLGQLIAVEKDYWILLTIIVIMRPNFGLTKERFKNRSIGTVLGGGMAFLLIYFIPDTTVYAILGICCYVVGLSMVQRNYKAAATFLTMYVLFVYALLNPEVFEVIQFRVLDTLIGAGLAYAGSVLLWPSWTIKNINETLKDAIQCDRGYLDEISKLYNTKGTELTAYKVSRKEAFLALSNLSYSFQRMTQEPKSQYKNQDEIFQMVMLMNSFLAALASLGTYIINNPTTPASKHFNAVVDRIKHNLLLSEELLANKALPEKEIQVDFGEELKSLAKQKEIQEKIQGNLDKDEAHLILEQFKWLLFNSQRIPKILKKIKFK